MGKERKGEGEREKGRSTNVERLIKVRANSMLEMFKKGEKRKEIQKEEREIEEMEAFRKSTKVEISPVKDIGGVGKI